MYYRIYSTESFFVDIIQLRKFKIVFTQPDHREDISYIQFLIEYPVGLRGRADINFKPKAK
jgi:hypothetical protein